MAKNYCTFIPNKGKDLFLGLKKQFGYKDARAIFLRAINPKFIKDYSNTLTLDSEGIPTLESVLLNPYMKKFIGDVKIISTLEKQYPLADNTTQGYNESLERAYNFNTTSPHRDNYIATVEYQDDKLQVKIQPKSSELVDRFKNQYGAEKLNTRMSEIFKPLGVTIGTLSSKEVKAGRVGVTDFSKARDTANGFATMIKVANNIEGAQAISEEYSHLLVGIFRNESLVDRAITTLSNDEEALKNILGDEYEDVFNFHEGDKMLIAEEAVGKLLQKNLLNEVNLDTTKRPSLFRRMIDFIKNKFKSFSLNDVEQVIFDADTSMNNLAKTILNGTRQITKEDIAESQREVQFNALSDRIERNINILKEAAKVEVKRYKISSEKNKVKSKDKVEKILKYTEEDADTVLGIFNYASEALSSLRSLSTQFGTIDTMTPEQKFKFLRFVRQYIQSYGNFIKNMNDAVLNEEDEEDNMFLSTFEYNGNEISVQDVIKELNTLSEQLTRRFSKVAIPSFAEFLKPFMGESITVPFGKYAGTTMSVEQLLRESERDISFLDRWIDSMADSSDILLQLFDSAVKSAKDKARMETIKILKELEALRLKAQSKGIDNFDWMFEKDYEGNYSGNYISAVNYAQFEKELKDFEAYLEDKYGKNPKGKEAKAKLEERTNWLKEHAIIPFGTPMPDMTLYRNKDFDRLTKDQLEIYDEFLAIKQRMDKKLPNSKVSLLKAVQMRKSGAERFLQSAGSPTTMYENIKNNIAETFLDRADDDALFGEAKGVTDFTGREFMMLPVLYTNRLENPNEISTDAFGSMMAYAYMACNFEQMDKIIDPLEVGRAIVNDTRQVRKTKGDKPLVEKFESLGIEVLNKVLHVDGNNAQQKLDDFFESQVYGRHLKDEGSWEVLGKSVNKNKLTSWLLSLSSTAQLGFNWLANIANVGNGIAMQNIEAAAGEFFNAKELLAADAAYTSEMKDFVLELGSRNKTSKLALFDELFNIRQNFEEHVRKSKKNLLHRMFGANIGFIGQEAGDHWLYNRTAIAMAKRQKLNVPGKGTISLWDALEIREVANGVKEMYLPEGTTDANGEEFSITKFSRRVAHVNQHLFGIYNEEDSNAANRVAMGRLLMQYRKWMKPLFNKRFQKAQYSTTLEEFEEGYYRTLGRHVGLIFNELKRGEFQLAAHWNEMTDHEKSNVRRALFEMAQCLCVVALANWVEWSDDKNRPWAIKYAEYMAQRMAHELGNLTPSTIMLNELSKTVQSPVPAMGTVRNLLNLFNSVISPEDWTNEIQSGPYKGMSTLEKNIMKSPLQPITYYRQMDKFINELDTSISYYTRPY